jgi:hypothetical protein
MRNAFKVLSLLAVIFSLAACGDGSGGGETTAGGAGAGGGDSDLSGAITISPSSNVYTGMELSANYTGGEAVSYQWMRNGTNAGTNSSKFTPSEEGKYTVTVSSTGYKSKTSAEVGVVSLPDNKVVVAFKDWNGDTLKTDVIDKNSSVQKPTNDPTQIGYTFKEWQLSGAAYDFNQPVTQSITLVAKYEPITYTINFIANMDGATGDAASITATYGVQVNLKGALIKTGYQMTKWTELEDGGGINYNPGQGVTNLRQVQGDEINLYGKWQEVGQKLPFYYGVVPVATLNFLKGTNAAAENGWKNALGLPGAPGAPTANSHAHLGQIDKSTPVDMNLSGNNYWFIMTPKSFGTPTITCQGLPLGHAGEFSASYNEDDYFLYYSTSTQSWNLDVRVSY